MRGCTASFFYRFDSLVLGIYHEIPTLTVKFTVEDEVELNISDANRRIRIKLERESTSASD